jgi:ABC-2 type transport system ATP-binding protein
VGAGERSLGKRNHGFLTTQYLKEAEYLADHIAILHGGTIIAEGSPQYLKEILPQRGTLLSFESEAKASEAREVLEDNAIVVDSVIQDLPSLEDIFLALIDDAKEEDSHV